MGRPDDPMRHGRYVWEFSGYDGGEAWLDISRDQGGWSGCGHASTIDFTRAELVAVLARLDAEVAAVEAGRLSVAREKEEK